ncbi:hypothetical protein LOTGIDRAFT_165354 [Lottia gigantea]|uniref:Fucolectin tachylectin-4 pentraxin-1 domain-containing protein n=1 Tax=Lottia gigantea TaxID=225164 RepID=V4A5N3_LOTGI|nr:hypothetical protein LOTGIDRAFT_165354 [Lottia gigantea]ESO88571.1 hypothetical protein LOTGIDRAFT_165354 [Lottia gigantea]
MSQSIIMPSLKARGSKSHRRRNLAFGKDTSQSSTYYVLSSSSNAVDGNTDGEWWNGSCTHTDFINGPKWWCVNLRAPERFHTIRLYNRNGAKERLQGFSIKVSNTGGCDQNTFDSSQVCYTDESSTPQDVYSVHDCKEGQFIFITVPAQQTLTLCEVKILQGDLLNYNIVHNMCVFVMHNILNKWMYEK